MKVKVISRNPSEYLRETKHDIHKVPRNYDPKLHPFEVPREYQRALNAVKLDKVFAKPLLGSLDGHADVVQCLLRHPTSLSTLVSGACDGEVRIWNVPNRKCVRSISAYNGIVRAVCAPRHGNYFFTVDNQALIKQWSLHVDDELDDEFDPNVPMNTIVGKQMTMSMDHHHAKSILATCGEKLQLYEECRSDPIMSYLWGVDTVYSVRFNPVETDVLAATASDRSITLYDIRQPKPLRRVTQQLRANTVAWNPMEAFNFTAASEDYSLYTFDMRNLSLPQMVHKDHVGAVIDVDYSPTGREFASGSYDKTVRIFDARRGHSRDVYHTKRMQRLTCVTWSGDAKYIMCGSDEMDIRIWKARAAEKLGVRMHREESNFRYQEQLKKKFANHPEIRRIARHRHVPKSIRHAASETRTIVESKQRKEANRRVHSKPGAVPYKAERTRSVLREDE